MDPPVDQEARYMFEERYRVKAKLRNLLGETLSALSYSPSSRFLAASDTSGTLLVVNCESGAPAYRAVLSDGRHVTVLKWGIKDELFVGLDDGEVVALSVSAQVSFLV